MFQYYTPMESVPIINNEQFSGSLRMVRMELFNRLSAYCNLSILDVSSGVRYISVEMMVSFRIYIYFF